MSPESLERHMRSALCGDVAVRAVPAGLAISSAFKDTSGDPITFYVVEDLDGIRIEDDGEYLSHLIGSGVPIDAGQRSVLLDGILKQGQAYWDRETFEIRTGSVDPETLPDRLVGFMSSLIRVRDLELLTRETVRSAFRDDAVAALRSSFEAVADVEEDAYPAEDLSEWRADVVIRPRENFPTSSIGAIYLASSNDKLNEALLVQQDLQLTARKGVSVVALIEDSDFGSISRKRFQRAQNRSLTMPIFRGDEGSAMGMIRRKLDLPIQSTVLTF